MIINSNKIGGAERVAIEQFCQCRSSYSHIADFKLVLLDSVEGYSLDFPHMVIINRKSFFGTLRNSIDLIREIKSATHPIIIAHLRQSIFFATILKFCVGRTQIIRYFHSKIEKSTFWRLFLNLSTKYFETSIFVSEASKSCYEIFTPDSPSVVISNGTSVAWSENKYITQLDKSSHNIKFYFAGRLVKSKRVDKIICAFNQLSNDQGKELHIYGTGQQEMYLKSLVSDSARIFFHGQVRNLEAHIEDKDVLIMMSDHEAFGLVAIEALAMGKPVITSINGATENIITKCDIVLQTNSEAALLEAIKVFDEDNDFFSYESKLERKEKIARHYSLEKNVENLIKSIGLK